MMLCTPVLALLCLVPQDKAPKTISVKHLNGRTSRVQVLELMGAKVRLKVLVMGGSMDIIRPLTSFEPASAFAIEVEGREA